MWKRSWLSREVLLFTLFSFFGGGYATLLLAAHFFGLHVPAPARLVMAAEALAPLDPGLARDAFMEALSRPMRAAARLAAAA